ncbi:MAG: hypothetical protein AB1342_13270 [Pseudomonadota bacterium]
MNGSSVRNDGSIERQLYAVLTRMAQLCNLSAECSLSDCRRARKCIGTERRCVWTLPREITLPRENVTEWRELVARRARHLAALARK